MYGGLGGKKGGKTEGLDNTRKNNINAGGEDDEKAVFFRKGEEPFVKNMADLTEEQVYSIKALRLPPPPIMMKRPPIEGIVDNWGDPKQFGV